MESDTPVQNCRNGSTDESRAESARVKALRIISDYGTIKRKIVPFSWRCCERDLCIDLVLIIETYRKQKGDRHGHDS